MGALASGAAAAVGSGAFTSVEADRSVDVEVAGDSSSYLALSRVTGSKNSQKYVSKSNGEISFNFSDSNGSVDGTGFNPDATTQIDSLLNVSNQGTQNVNFWINISSLSTGSADVTFSTDGDISSSQLAYDGSNSGSVTEVTLSPGDSITLDLKVDTTGQGIASTSDTITFVAEAGGSPGA